jgi:hypothetical protein
MKRVLLCLVLLVLLCVPVLGWSDTLNNGERTYYTYGNPFTYTARPGFLDTVYAHSASISSTWSTLITPNSSTSSNYFAATMYNSNGNAAIGMLDSTRSAFYGYPWYSNGLLSGYNYNRLEFVRSGTNMLVYVDGSLSQTFTSVPGTPAYSYSLGSHASGSEPSQWYIDDISFGNAFADTGLVSVMPHSWYIMKDMINPSNFYMIDSSGNLVYSDHFDVQWSLGAYADGWQASQNPPNNRYRIAITGADQYVVYNEYINITAAGAATGIISIPMNQTYIGNSPLSYGQYLVRLYDGSAVKSTDYFYVIGTGATIAWGNPTYTIGSTAAITYSISSSYYDTATYTYKIEIIDIYGNIQKTQTINGQAGSISVSLDSSTYSDGVYYAEIIATPKSGGSDIAMNYAATEINSYITLSGYVMNAETGATLSGATVNVSQLSTSLVSTSDVNGSYSNNNNWLSGSEINITTNLTGYTTDVNVFTPLTADAITLNISLIPSPPTYSGIAIGGIVRDNQYHNVIPSATVYKITNVSRTGSGSATTNIAGYYRFDSLVNGTVYDIWSSKTGFANSTVEQKLAVGT